MNSVQIVSSILQAANNKLVSKEFQEKYRIGNSFSRSRKLSFSTLIYFILQSVPKSIPINYSQLLDSFPSPLPFVSKQAISKARQKISDGAFQEFFRLSVNQFYQSSSHLATWNGYSVFAVDGSTIQIPESKENVRVFGGNPNQTQKQSPLASVSVLYDVSNDILVDASLHSYRYSERESAKKHMKYLSMVSNPIVLFDRGYPSETFFHFLQNRNIPFLMRVPKSYKKLIFESQDHQFSYFCSLTKNTLTLRAIHFPLADGSVEYLVTNVTQKQIQWTAFKELYHLRWGVESKYRELKNRLQLEAFQGIKPICIRQEFFTAMFFSNLAAILKRDADTQILAWEQKHRYQANRSYLLNRIKAKIIPLLQASISLCKRMIIQLIEKASKVRSILRPNRTFGRYRTHTRRRYYNHMKPCV